MSQSQTITVDCPKCGRKLKAPAGLAGRVARCPQCQTVVKIPASDAVEPSAAVPIPSINSATANSAPTNSATRNGAAKPAAPVVASAVVTKPVATKPAPANLASAKTTPEKTVPTKPAAPVSKTAIPQTEAPQPTLATSSTRSTDSVVILQPFNTPSPQPPDTPNVSSWDMRPIGTDPWAPGASSSVSEPVSGETYIGGDPQWPKLLSPPPPNSDEEWEVEPEEMAKVGGFLVWIVFLVLVVLIGTMVWQYEWILEQMQSLFK